ncbi:beta-galactosidase [Virgibacillus salexigens]|uniref:beta-galactosidase n=1 Tax=Virgibacillus massiliensis TaxID=1462526 RepID=UPI001370F28A|nr:beta-galactosidase [Virgibacillus massiliensis]MYL40793.1 beta-galactosidase [Virgibacillus massiliensis]
MVHNKLQKIWYGGDYNPEQWDEATWDEDIRMFKLAGIDVATINVFSWAIVQRGEDTYDFTFLDEMMEKLYKNGVYVCLATGTGAHPAWMAKTYTDILRTDFDGRKRKFGGRHNSCPNSPTYRKYASRMAEKLANRYQNHPALVLWHVSNEYGGYCYCDNCTTAFRQWLKRKYDSLQAVNKAWNTNFWGHTFYDWDEIVLPNGLSEEWGSGRNTNFQGISLDYRRFQSDSLLTCYKLERDAIRKHDQQIPITTNLMGLYEELDYFSWAKEMDVISWDNYPSIDTPESLTAMTHDLMRGLKSGQPFLLMEQTPSQQNWQPYNSLKRPGVMRLWSYQAVAHGADSVLFFQLRRSVGATEKFHGAVIEHVGHEHTRVFKETSKLGNELMKLDNRIIGSRVTAKVAIVFDWENRWGVHLSSGPSVALDYVTEVHKYYEVFYDNNIPIDLIGTDENLENYDVVIAPVLYMIKEGYATKVGEFVEHGGTFITTFFSGIVNENDLVTLGGYPGQLRNLLGIWVEEIDALPPNQKNQIVMKKSWGKLEGSYTCNLLFDLLHTEGAEVLASYGSDFYRGMPVVTKNHYGNGEAFYIASSPDKEFLSGFLKNICAEKAITPLVKTKPGVEVTKREMGETAYLFVLNHQNHPAYFDLGEIQAVDLLSGSTFTGECSIDAKDVLVLQQSTKVN